MVNTHLIAQRLARAGLTPHTVAALVGIHPRDLTEDSARDLSDLPIGAVLTIARTLDVDPADLVDGLIPVPAVPTTLTRRVLAALAHTAVPLSADQLAYALETDTESVEAVLAEVVADDEAAFPFAVRRVGSRAFALAPRLGVLAEAEHARLDALPAAQEPLTPEQGRALFLLLHGESVAGAGMVELQEAGLVSAQEPLVLCEDLSLAFEPEGAEVTQSKESSEEVDR